jgi:hypothetical protein
MASASTWSVVTKWHQPLRAAMIPHAGQTMGTRQINVVINSIPGIGNEAQFVQPSDHCTNHTNAGACQCAMTDGAIFERLGHASYLVR